MTTRPRYAASLQSGDTIRYWGVEFEVLSVTPNTDHVAITLKGRQATYAVRLQKTQILDVVEK